MSTLALNHVLHRVPAWLIRAADRVLAFLAGLDEARTVAQRFETLARMSDAELAEHGLKREDIPRAAFAHAPRA